tara:strand:- start:83 stop:604 length:522 start_codon:yes stop_codon:yes gene_type:complete
MKLDVILRHGRGLVEENGLDPTHVRVVWELLQEATATLKRIPVNDMRPFYAAEQTIWPKILQETIPQYMVDLERTIANDPDLYQPPERRGSVHSSFVDRMDEVLGWFSYIQGHKRRRDISITFAAAANIPPVATRRKYGVRRGTYYAIVDKSRKQIADHVAVRHKKELTFSEI